MNLTIEKLGVTDPERLQITLSDGRILILPVEQITGLAQLTPAQGENWQIIDGQNFHFPKGDERYQLKSLMKLEPLIPTSYP